MKTVLFHAHGGPETLTVCEAPDPIPSRGEVVIKVGACAVNHLDIWMRSGTRGWTIPLPHVLGNDIAGEVVSLGTEVQGWSVGDRVLVHPGLFCGDCRYCRSGHTNRCESFGIIGAHRWGGYAEFVAAPARNLARMPASLDFEQAAAVPLSFLTAWHMIHTRAQAVAGETVLVMAAASGIGTAAIQTARMAGLTVIAAASSDAKLALARELGSHHTVNYSDPDWPKAVRDLTGGNGVDLVIEHIGGQMLGAAFKSLAKGGRVVTCGATEGVEISLDLRFVYSRELQLVGSMLGRRDEFDKAMSAIEQGHMRPVVDSIMPLAAAADAHRRMADRDVRGKLVLIP